MRLRIGAPASIGSKELGSGAPIRLVDDFGTGYSSLSSLQSFPLDCLKIDRTFVSRMEFETEQLAMLRELGCEYGQGYFFSSAVDSASIADWMERPPRWT